MTMGKPIVAFDLAETRFTAQDAALYAKPNQVEDFANKIEILLDDEELRLKMGARGRKRIEEALSWDYSKQNLLLAYEQLFHPQLKPFLHETTGSKNSHEDYQDTALEQVTS
jgi:glycosyltransferase involved in cell wall biosynthesis